MLPFIQFSRALCTLQCQCWNSFCILIIDYLQFVMLVVKSVGFDV